MQVGVHIALRLEANLRTDQLMEDRIQFLLLASTALQLIHIQSGFRRGGSRVDKAVVIFRASIRRYMCRPRAILFCVGRGSAGTQKSNRKITNWWSKRLLEERQENYDERAVEKACGKDLE